MIAIYKREMRAFFTSPSGYLYISMFWALSSFLFCFFTLLAGKDSSITSYFTVELFVVGLMTPLLTMRSFAEERKLKTEQLLLTAPVSLPGMVLGKFLASYTIFGATFLCSCIGFPVAFSHLDGDMALWQYNSVRALGGCVALLLVGAAFIAIGVLISSLTENQFVAAAGTLTTLALLLLISFLNSVIGFAPIRAVFNWLSIYARFANFSAGYFDFSALLYYASVCFVCLFLTVRVYEKRRWA